MWKKKTPTCFYELSAPLFTLNYKIHFSPIVFQTIDFLRSNFETILNILKSKNTINTLKKGKVI